MSVLTFFVGFLLILAGVVFFMKNFGYHWWGFARQVLSYWPLLLVIIGISLHNF